MKEFYRVQYMDHDNYCDMMNGSYNYHVYDVDIMAESAEEAYAICKAKFPEMIVNNHVRSVAEIEAKEAAWQAERAEKKRKEAERKAAKTKWEAEHPEEVLEKKRQAKIKRYQTLIKNKKLDIAALEKELACLERKLKALEN